MSNQITLADSFLADLNDLSDNEAEDMVYADAEKMEEDLDKELAVIGSLKDDYFDSVSKLEKAQRYNGVMQKVEEALQKDSDVPDHAIVLEDDPVYQLIIDCNALSVDIENEIIIIHNFIRGKYRLKFPELESLVRHPIDYARVVKKIGNETDLTRAGLEGLLLPAIIMAVFVTASITSGKPLSEDVLQKTIEACDRALNLDLARKKILDFVASRMVYIAPNLSAIVGSAVAAKLMGTAGVYAITDMRKLANRIQFGVAEESSLGDGLGEGYGMLGQAGSGKLRMSSGPSKLKVVKSMKKRYGSSGTTTGLTSNLAFTPVQGIELSNPQACVHQLGSGTRSTYFSATVTFSKINSNLGRI